MNSSLDQETASTASPQLTAVLMIEVLFQFFRQTELHEPTNDIFIRCVENVERVIRSLRIFPEFHPIQIFYRGEQIYVNDIRLRPKPRQFRIYRYLIRFMRTRQLGGIRIAKELSPEDLRSALWAAASLDPRNEHTVEEAMKSLQAQGIEGFELDPLRAINQVGGESAASLTDVELVGLILHEKIRKFTDVCFSNLGRSKDFSLGKLDDYLSDLVSLPEEDILQVFRLHLSKKHDRYLSFFATDVCFSSIAWARSLGLPAGVIAELAGASLAHALVFVVRGKVDDQPLSPDELARLYQLQIEMKDVWKLNDLQSLSLMEWTFPFGPEGVYEWNSNKCHAHFFSRMIRIVSKFNQLTHFLPGESPLLPDEAMTRLMSMEREFDPTLLKLFVNWLGIYPVGTLVQLQSGEIGQVFASGSDPLRFQRPIISVLKDSDGRLLDRPRLLDLTEMNEKLGIYRKSIKRSLTAEEAALSDEILRMSPQGI